MNVKRKLERKASIWWVWHVRNWLQAQRPKSCFLKRLVPSHCLNIRMRYLWPDQRLIWSEVTLASGPRCISGQVERSDDRKYICLLRLSYHLSRVDVKISSCPANSNSLISPRVFRRFIDKALCLCRYSASDVYLFSIYHISYFRAIWFFGGTEAFYQRRKQLYQWVPRKR